MAEAQPVAWTWDVMSHNRDNITSDRAHAVLCKYQKSFTKQSLDLTNGRLFDWWGYLTGHPRGRDIVGSGVTKFELRFLRPGDPAKQPLLYFIVHRCGWELGDTFTHVRLRPQNYACECTLGPPSPKEPVVEFGYLHEWVDKYVPGFADGVPSPVGRAWVVGWSSASDFIRKLNREERVWFKDLTDELSFSWRQYLSGNRLFKAGASQLLQGNAGPRGEGGRWVDLEPRASP